jgi:hypothetical protein
VAEVSVVELARESARLSGLIDNGVQALTKAARDAAEAERDYRKAKALAWTQVKAEGERTAEHMKAEAEARSADLRFVRDLAEANRQAALEALRSRRQQLSASQSVSAAFRAEAEHSRYGSEVRP